MLLLIQRRYIDLLVCVLAIVIFAGCAQQRRQILPDRVKAYHMAYKEKDFRRAAIFVNDPEEFIKKAEALSRDLVILDFEIIRFDISPEGYEAEVEVVRTYHLLPSVVVKEQQLLQKWTFDPERKNWFLISPY